MINISHRRCEFTGQTNSVLCDFRTLAQMANIGCLKLFCSDMYGCELWHLEKRSSADADNRLDAFSGQSRSTNMVTFHM